MTTKKSRIKHSPEFKAEALKLADKVGVAAAKQLSLHESQIYGWRKNSKKDTNTSQREQKLATEVTLPEQVIVHSDRGSQYCSKDCRNLITAYNLKQSMGRKGNCGDNACVESFFYFMKVEAIQYEPIITRGQIRQTIFEYIEVDYNRT